jgi:hypothetical protein
MLQELSTIMKRKTILSDFHCGPLLRLAFYGLIGRESAINRALDGSSTYPG